VAAPRPRDGSSKGGTASNFNELRFEDKKGEEEVYVQAEKDMNILVKNDENRVVGHDRMQEVGNDETSTIEGNRTAEVTKDKSITIHGSRNETVDKDETIDSGGAREVHVAKADQLSVGAGRRATSTGDDQLKVSKKILFDGGDEIMLKSGDASITLKKDGTIILKGKDVSLTASGKRNAKASSDVIIKGSKVSTNRESEPSRGVAGSLPGRRPNRGAPRIGVVGQWRWDTKEIGYSRAVECDA
jgi:type VI secretion system secreted protein VgrG